MEHEDRIYRDNLSRLQEKADGKEVLNLRETAKILGFRDVRTVKKLYPFVNGNRIESSSFDFRILYECSQGLRVCRKHSMPSRFL